MFEQSMVEAYGRTNRGGPVLMSLALQATVIGGAILVPLLHPELLPKAVMNEIFRVAPPLPPAKRVPMAEGPARVRVERLMGLAPYLAPTGPIKPVRLIDDGDATVGVVGMEGLGAPEPGVVGSVLSDLVRQAHVAPPSAPPVATPKAEPPKPVERIRLGGDVQDAKVISRIIPVYPRVAIQARLEGKVTFTAVIGRDGTIQQLQLTGGHPMFVQAATDAVRQWRYRPTLLNNDPVEVLTTIEVTFRLNR